MFVITFLVIPQEQSSLQNKRQNHEKNASAIIDVADPPDYFSVDKPAVALRKILPRYPHDLPVIKPGHNSVWLKMLVDKTGLVRKAIIIKSDDPLLNKFAIDAAKQWEFAPAILNEHPVETWVTQWFKFRSYQ
ncbi:MAG: energy transducer TonB [Bacteroidota bacterium]